MTKYLIDTDWAIHFLNGQSDVIQRLRELREPGNCVLSLISLAEIYEGVYFSRNPELSQLHLDELLAGVIAIGIDDDICRVFGKLRGELRAKRKMIADFDLFIGATAIQHQLTLLTNNRRHFERIEGLHIISVPTSSRKKV